MRMQSTKKDRAKVTVGWLLKEIRLRKRLTLRMFSLDRGLDPVRYSLIERNKLKPNINELNNYLDLIFKENKDG